MSGLAQALIVVPRRTETHHARCRQRRRVDASRLSNDLDDGGITAVESAGGARPMTEPERRTTGASGDAVDAAFAVVAVSVALGRLVAVRVRQESRRLLWRRLGPVIDALLPRSVPARLDVDALVEELDMVRAIDR
jgi:hypothetical protein